MSEPSLTRRGDLMRQIAALHAQVDSLDRERTWPKQTAKREELKREIDVLMEKLMAP